MYRNRGPIQLGSGLRIWNVYPMSGAPVSLFFVGATPLSIIHIQNQELQEMQERKEKMVVCKR